MHNHTQKHIYTHTHMHNHTNICMHNHGNNHINIYMHNHANIYTYTITHTQSHKHVYICNHTPRNKHTYSSTQNSHERVQFHWQYYILHRRPRYLISGFLQLHEKKERAQPSFLNTRKIIPTHSNTVFVLDP